MGNGITYIMNCCGKNDNKNLKDIDIIRINSKLNYSKDINSPTKETQKDNYETLMKTDIKDLIIIVFNFL